MNATIGEEALARHWNLYDPEAFEETGARLFYGTATIDGVVMHRAKDGKGRDRLIGFDYKTSRYVTR